MKILIKPLPIEKWHGKKGSDDFSRGRILRPLVDSSTYRFKTGLTDKDKAKVAAQLDGIDLDDKYAPGKESFWTSNSVRIKLGNTTTILDTSKSIYDFIKWKLCLASNYVANSYEEWEAGKFPEASYYIFSEEEEITRKATKVKVKKEAYVIMSKLTVTMKRNIVMVGLNKNTGNLTEDDVDGFIGDMIEKNPQEFIELANLDKKYLAHKAFLYEAKIQGVVTRKGLGWYYLGETLGATTDDAIDYLSSEEGKQLKSIIAEKLM